MPFLGAHEHKQRRIWRPRMAVRMWVPPMLDDPTDRQTEAVELPVAVHAATLESNDHNHADTLHFTASYKSAGCDPRLLKNGRVFFWIGEADEYGHFLPSRLGEKGGQIVLESAQPDFVGTVRRVRRVHKSDGGVHVEIEAVDYTQFFLDAKKFPSAGVPDMSQTLPEAWERICDYVGPLDPATGKVLSVVEDLKGAIEFRGGIDPNTKIGKSAPERFTRQGARVNVRPETDAWAVWAQTCGMLGLITFFEGDKLVVTTATDHYSADEAPRLIWGRNILEAEEELNTQYFGKGVVLTSFDVFSGTVLESVCPDPTDPRIHTKKVTARRPGHGRARAKSSAPADLIDATHYEAFATPWIQTQEALDEAARRVYEERSRQELQGKIKTGKIFVEAVDGSDFNLLALRAGDTVRLELDGADKNTLSSLDTQYDRVEYLVARGYDRGVANLIARSYDALGKLDPTFHTKGVRTHLSLTEDGGEFYIEIAIHNLIRAA